MPNPIQVLMDPVSIVVIAMYAAMILWETLAPARPLPVSRAWLAPEAEWFFLVFVLLGFTEGALLVSGIPVSMEFSAAEKRPTYMGLTNSSVGVVSMVGPLIGAALALAGYDWLFLVSAALSLLALITLHWWVQEPRYTEASTKS